MATAATRPIKNNAKATVRSANPRPGPTTNSTKSFVTGPIVIPISAIQNLGVSVAPKPRASYSNIAVSRPTPILLPPFAIAESQIDAKYSQLGGAGGFLGNAISELQASKDGVGFFKAYQGGSIYFSPSTGAHEVQGAIRDRWQLLGSETGFLGYPLTDETGTPDGVGRYNHFQYGSIYWTLGTGAYEVHGAIRDEWASLGWERSVVGYPVTNETGTPDGVGRYNHFQAGSIYWTPGTGAHEVHGAIRDKWASMGWERSFLGYPTTDETGVDFPLIGAVRMSNFQNGSITWTSGSGALATPASAHYHDVLTSGLPLGGWVDITLNAQGDVTFSGSLHNSGFDNIDYTLSAVIVSASGASIGFQHSGHTEGTIAGLPFGTPNRDDPFVTPEGLNNQQIAANWDQLKQGSLFWRLDATDTLTEGAAQLLGDLATKALEVLGAAATASLVALIFV
jgi:uncharacterized protein with LGFP repeats